MVTEKPSSGASSTKLYYWDKKKFFLMNYELSDQIPAKVRFNVSSAGDLTLCVSSGSSGEFDSFYVYPKDSINYSYKKTVYRLFNAKFDSRLKQEVYFSEPDFGFYNNVSVNNYNGYARSKSFVLDSSFYKGADAEGLPREMDWKQ